jgi:hypothetical protein
LLGGKGGEGGRRREEGGGRQSGVGLHRFVAVRLGNLTGDGEPSHAVRLQMHTLQARKQVHPQLRSSRSRTPNLPLTSLSRSRASNLEPATDQPQPNLEPATDQPKPNLEPPADQPPLTPYPHCQSALTQAKAAPRPLLWTLTLHVPGKSAILICRCSMRPRVSGATLSRFNEDGNRRSKHRTRRR